MRLATTRLAWEPRMFGCLQARDVLCHFLLFGRELFYGRRKLIDPIPYDGETKRYRLQLLHEISEKLLQAPQARPVGTSRKPPQSTGQSSAVQPSSGSPPPPSGTRTAPFKLRDSQKGPVAPGGG